MKACGRQEGEDKGEERVLKGTSHTTRVVLLWKTEGNPSGHQ